MNSVLKHSLRFVVLVLLQVLIFNKLDLGFGIHLMVYPLFIMLLPFDIGVVAMMLLAFVTGLTIDAFSDTFGLHASALVLVAYLRPLIFKAFSPRDGYDTLREPNVFEMGQQWFIYTFGILLVIHHLWFFMIEIFKMNELLFTLKKLVLSVPISFIFCILLQFIFIKRVKTT